MLARRLGFARRGFECRLCLLQLSTKRNSGGASICFAKLNRSDYFELDGDWSRKAIDFNCGTTGLRVFEIFGVQAIVGCEIIFHISKKNSYVNHFVPGRTCFFKNYPDIFKYRMTLGFYIIRGNFTVGIQLYSGNYFCSSLSWPHSGKKKQIAHFPGMRISANRFRSA